MNDPAALAKAVVDANSYLTLGTADADGHPWVSPVWFAHADYREFFWVSRPEARHSQNIAARPEISIVVFDSRVPVGSAEAVYLTGTAAPVEADHLSRAIDVFSTRSVARIGRAWTEADVTAPGSLRLYRAVAVEASVLGPGDQRLPFAVR